MDPNSLVLFSALVSLIGVGASLYIGLSLYRIGSTIMDKGLILSSVAMYIFGFTLLIEVLVNLMAPMHISRPGHRPQEILSLLINRGTVTAIPLYTLSYAFMAVSHFVSGVSLEESNISRKEFAVIPIFLLVFIDYNIIDLIVLIIATILVLGKYGSTRLPTAIFYTILGLSHLMVVVLLVEKTSWWIVPVSTLLRGLAPIILYISSFNRKLGTRGSRL